MKYFPSFVWARKVVVHWLEVMLRPGGGNV